MKTISVILLSFYFISCGGLKKDNSAKDFATSQMLYLNTDSENITLKLNGEKFPWKVKEGDLKLPFREDGNTVVFKSAVDSVSIKLTPGESISLAFVLNSADTTDVNVLGLSNPANFSHEFIKENRGKFTVYTSKVQELVHIAIALTEYAEKDKNLINKNTDYYKEMLSLFKQHQDHPLVKSLNANFNKYGYSYYYNLNMNACMYSFDDDIRIINEGPYLRMSFGGNNLLEGILEQFEDFVRVSEFHDFYFKNQNYYNSLTNDYYKLVPVYEMWNWLENKYPLKYDAYKVYFSPLVGGAHATQQFKDNDYSETIMFISAPVFSKDLSYIENQLESSKTIFTEIDHNYVNPASQQYFKEIEISFNDRFFWVLDDPGLDGYSTPQTIFNEYMTWGLFSLFCIDHFPSEATQNLISKMEHEMIVKRGFIKFRDFNQQLLALNNENKNLSLEDLMKKSLKWAEKQQVN